MLPSLATNLGQVDAFGWAPCRWLGGGHRSCPPGIGQKEGNGETGGTYVEEISSLRSRGESQIDEEIDTGSH